VVETPLQKLLLGDGDGDGASTLVGPGMELTLLIINGGGWVEELLEFIFELVVAATGLRLLGVQELSLMVWAWN